MLLTKKSQTSKNMSLLVRDFFGQKQRCNHALTIVFFPDLVPCDFFLFPTPERPVKEKRFSTIGEIKFVIEKRMSEVLGVFIYEGKQL